jgi:RNA polymerase sigma-70 factor, ECF subfamily
MEESDDELLAKVAAGDGVAFAHLVARHRARLIAMAARIVGNRSVAEEIVQETFARAWIRAPRWRKSASERSTLGAWLRRVATNLAIDQTRRVRFVSLEAAPEQIDPETQPDAKLIDAEDRRRLETALQALPPRQRAAITLTYDEGLSNADGAAAMDTSVGAFELLLVRARRALRQAMMKEDGQ